MPRIFTTNSQLTEEDNILPRRRNAKQQHAIDRRYRKIGPLTEPLQRLGRISNFDFIISDFLAAGMTIESGGGGGGGGGATSPPPPSPPPPSPKP